MALRPTPSAQSPFIGLYEVPHGPYTEAQLWECDIAGRPLFHRVLRYGTDQDIQLAMKAGGANPLLRAAPQTLDTGLHVLATMRRLDLAPRSVLTTKNLSTPNKDLTTPAHLAAGFACLDQIPPDQLTPALLMLRGQYDRTPLYEACGTGYQYPVPLKEWGLSLEKRSARKVVRAIDQIPEDKLTEEAFMMKESNGGDTPMHREIIFGKFSKLPRHVKTDRVMRVPNNEGITPQQLIDRRRSQYLEGHEQVATPTPTPPPPTPPTEEQDSLFSM